MSVQVPGGGGPMRGAGWGKVSCGERDRPLAGGVLATGLVQSGWMLGQLAITTLGLAATTRLRRLPGFDDDARRYGCLVGGPGG